MSLIEEIKEYFGTNSLYEVINVHKDANEETIKKAYRKASLKVHPDRVADSDKTKATKRFQALAQVHYILSDAERRKLYDDHGIIANDDTLDSEANWADYWHNVFPKISEKEIQKFLDSYMGSEEQESDLIAIYNRYKGDLDLISEAHIAYDEEKTTQQLERLIEEGKIQKYKNFIKESNLKKLKRKKRYEKEARQAKKMKEEMQNKTGKNVDDMNELTALIKQRQQGNFDSMIANLEAKYATKKKKKKPSSKS